MLILAVPFVFGPLRDAQSGRRLLVGAVIGIVYMVADRMLGQLALVYGIAPLLSALLPAALCALLGITMLVRIERLSAPRIQSVSAADGVSAGGPKGKGVAGMAGQSIRWERAKKPEKCPACGASPVAEILYGYYGHSPELEQDVEEGRITFGGCIVEDDDPDWKCTHCGAKIHQKQGPDVDLRII